MGPALTRSPSLRTLFAAVWLLVQALLILTAGRRINHAFGFRMFEESATIALHVERLVDDSGSLPIAAEWHAHDCRGQPIRYRWRDLVPSQLPLLDYALTAPYGADAALATARAAVAWVATHTPDDCETRAFAATVTRTRNGHLLDDISFTVRR
jgi:hypothetical protein